MSTLRTAFAVVALAGAIVCGGCAVPARKSVGSPHVTPVDLGETRSVWRSAGASFADLAVVWGGLTGPKNSEQAIDTGWIVSRKAGNDPLRTAAAPIAARSGHVAVGHSGLLLFWGGVDARGRHMPDGATLDPRANSWVKIPDAPFGIESPHVIVDGEYVLFGAGRRDGNGFNTSLLEYHFPTRTWREIPLRTSGIAAWALVGQRVATLSRQPDGADLILNWFDREGNRHGRNVSLDIDLSTAAYVGVTSHGEDAVVAASTRERTQVFQVSPMGVTARRDTLDGAVFSPAMSTAPGTSPDDTRREGDAWISLTEWEIQALSVSEMKSLNRWSLPTCRTESTWISLGDRKFLRYGGLGCGGDVPPDDGTPMQVIDLS